MTHTGLGGGLQIMGTSWTILSSIHIALVQLQNCNNSPGCVWKERGRGKRETRYEAVRLTTVMPEYLLQSFKTPYVY